ncbi:MAG: hypothetical protein J6Q59_07190 [Paludibacteraceae bacterium]|nr:hypothetical protein [Paludibacteraceae bacterium]
MTDEEMAEEYKESKRHKSFRTDIGKISIEYEAYLNNLKGAFLAGLKAGRVQQRQTLRPLLICRVLNDISRDVIAWKEIVLPEEIKEK